nr:hypothetical protein [Candidatus Sigynarchaeota archaeon]
MVRRYFLIINALYLITFPAWLVIKAASVGFDLGFSWQPQPDLFVSMEFTITNMVLLFTASAVLFIIGTRLLKKFILNKKDAPLLLAMFNFVLAGGLAWDGIRKYTTFTSPEFRNAVEGIIFVSVAWALVLLYLFLQDIFMGSFKFKDHVKWHTVFIILDACTVFFFLGWPALMPLLVSTYMAYFFMAALIIPLCAWQIRATYRLVKRTDDKQTKRGLSMIGYSAIFYLLALGTVAFKKLYFPLDLLLSISLLSASVVMYLGFVQPSKKS